MPCLRAVAPIRLPKLPWGFATQRPQRRYRWSASFTDSITSPAMSWVEEYSAIAFRDIRRSHKRLNPLESHANRRQRAGRQSSKPVHDGEPIVFVRDLRYLNDSITWTCEVFPGSTQWSGDPSEDSNPLRDRDRHQFGKVIAFPPNPQAIIHRVAQINTRAPGRIVPGARLRAQLSSGPSGDSESACTIEPGTPSCPTAAVIRYGWEVLVWAVKLSIRFAAKWPTSSSDPFFCLSDWRPAASPEFAARRGRASLPGWGSGARCTAPYC